MDFRCCTAFLTLFLMVVVPTASAAGQNAGGKSNETLAEAAKQGYPLRTETTVQGSITVQAALIPEPVARRVFGKEISRQYAVIALTVSNKSSTAALIVQGAFIDYGDWALSGSVGAGRGDASRVDHQFQESTQPNQVASEEYRIVRGQLLDAQPWTARNTIVRLLTIAGSLASGYSFSLKERGLIKGISAFNGAVVPGVGTFWPDGTVEQLNRISDFGYKTNKIISKQGSDIIVCFFPIDRFLTPGFKQVYLKSPALFFSPFEMLVDTTVQPQIEKLLGKEFLGADLPEMRNALPCYMRWQELRKPDLDKASADPVMKACMSENRLTPKVILALETLKKVSLNTIRVVIDGVMSVEAGSVPPKIESVVFDDGNDNPALWTQAGEKKGAIKGGFLTGGVPRVEEASLLGITDIAFLETGSTDQMLRFSFKLSRPISSGKKLTLVVEKKGKDSTGGTNNPIESMRYEFVVGYTLNAPEITKVELKDNKITITGQRFFGNSENPLSVHLLGNGKDINPGITTQSATKLTLDAPTELKPPGCWRAQVKVGEMGSPSGHDLLLVIPTPKIAGATRKESSIDVLGSELVDTSVCGGPGLSFQLVENKKDAKPRAMKATIESGEKATLELPDEARKGSWMIQVLLNKEVKDSKELQ